MAKSSTKSVWLAFSGTALFALSLILPVSGCGSVTAVAKPSTTTRQVAMGDLDATLAKLSGLDPPPLNTTRVEYIVTGKAKYDTFFKSSAELRASFVVSHALSETLTGNLKSFARSYVAAGAQDANIKKLVGDSSPDALTLEQSTALLALKKKRGKLSDEEKTFAAKSVVNTAQTVGYLSQASSKAQSLIDAAGSLSQSIATDFKGANATQAPQITDAVKTSLDNLREVPSTAQKLSKSLVRLEESLRSLL